MSAVQDLTGEVQDALSKLAILREALERIADSHPAEDAMRDIAREAIASAGRVKGPKLRADRCRRCGKVQDQPGVFCVACEDFVDPDGRKPAPEPEVRSCGTCARQLNGWPGASDECVYCHHNNGDYWTPAASGEGK